MVPDDLVQIVSWKERRSGEEYAHRLDQLRGVDLPDRIEKLFQQRRYATAHYRAEPDGDELAGVGKHPDTGRWMWWSEMPEAPKP